jgi:hypothetical protein
VQGQTQQLLKGVALSFLAVTLGAVGVAIGAFGPARLAKEAAARAIRVRAEFPVRRARECAGMPMERRIACVDDVLLPLARQDQVRLAMVTLERLAATDSDAAFRAHSYAHAVGMAAIDAGGDVYESFEACSPQFDGGCYHGVMQIALGRAPHVGADEINRLCGRYMRPNASAWYRFQCAHGMGHGLTMQYAYDLPRALAGCDLFEDSSDRNACYAGALMQNSAGLQYGAGSPVMHAVHSHADGHSAMPGSQGSSFKRFDPADPHYPCSALPDTYLGMCYHSQPALVLAMTGLDYAAALRMCDTAPVEWRTSCYHGYGNQIAAQASSNHALAAKLCAMGAVEYQPLCYDAVAKSRVGFTGDPRQGLAFCGLVEDVRSRTRCYAALGWELHFLGKSESQREEVCAMAAASDTAACRFGAALTAVAPSNELQP